MKNLLRNILVICFIIFIIKNIMGSSYDWTKRMGGASMDLGYCVTVDGSGNIYLTGGFEGTVNFASDWGGTDSKTSASFVQFISATS